MTVYADTSFLVSLYVLDSHSAEARRRVSSRPRLWVTPLHRAELAHAVEGLVFQDSLSRHKADEVYKDFETDLEGGVWAQVNIPDLAFEICAQLARRHTARLGNRTLDTLHVASALELKAERFWTFDNRQEKLAQAEGLKARL